MRACFTILLLCACTTSPPCGPEEETQSAWVHFHLEATGHPTSVMLTPAKPSSLSLGDLVLMEEPYWVLPPDEADLPFELPPYEGPFFQDDEAELVFFVASQFHDLNEDGRHSVGEPILGLSETVLVFFKQVGCGAWAGRFQAGWGALEFRESGPAPYSLDGLDLPANLLPKTTLQLTLGMEAPEDSRVMLTPEHHWNEEIEAVPLIDVASAESLLVELPEIPPEEHLQASSVDGTQFSDWFYGVELPLWVRNYEAYRNFGQEAGSVKGFCSDLGEAAKIAHYPEADWLEEALHLVSTSRTPGWGLYLEDPSGTWRQADPNNIGELSPLHCTD